MKKILIISGIIIFLQIINFLLMLPDYIPTWDNGIEIFTAVNYCLLLILFLSMFIMMIRKNIQIKADAGEWVKQIFVCLLSCVGMVIGCAFTIFAGSHFMSNYKLLKKYEYKNAKATVYVYDTSFLDPEITVKVRNGFWPIVHEIKWLRERSEDAVFFDEEKDCLYIYDRDTLVIDSKTIMRY